MLGLLTITSKCARCSLCNCPELHREETFRSSASGFLRCGWGAVCVARTGEEDGFDLEWRQVRMLGAYQGDDAGDMGSGKAVPRCDARTAIQPRHATEMTEE